MGKRETGKAEIGERRERNQERQRERGRSLSVVFCGLCREAGSLIPSTTTTPVEGLNLDTPIQFDMVSPVEGGPALTPLTSPPKSVMYFGFSLDYEEP